MAEPERGWRPRLPGLKTTLAVLTVVIGVPSAILAIKQLGASGGSESTLSSTQGSIGANSVGAGHSTTHSQASLGRQLTSARLNAVLVPQSDYQKLPTVSDNGLQADSDSYALQGGIPSLKLCNSPIQAPGLGADSSSSYESVTVLPGNIYFGSDAGSFSGQGAAELLSTAASQGPSCDWRSLPGPQLDDQVVRLTKDQSGPEDTTLHNDLILVRSGAAVLEVGTAVFSGSHSADAEMLAEGAARRLAQAERGGTT